MRLPESWNHQAYFENLLQPVNRVVMEMEREGVPVDLDVLRDIEFRMAVRKDELLATLKDWTGDRDVNWNSWQQLASWLHDSTDEGGLGIEPSPYCKKGEVPDDKIATDDRALEWLAGHSEEHRASIQCLRQLRQCTRMGRYARDWLEKALPHRDGTWRLHPSFGLATDADTRPGARTGRFGVKNPPLNQVPRDPKKDPAGMRSAFVPPPGYKLVVVDYSQLEVVILAHLISILFGDDDPLVQNVRAGRDIHGPAAQFIFGKLAGNREVEEAPLSDFKGKYKPLRDLGKIGIYGKNYGKGVRGFAWSTFLDDGQPLGEERAKLLVDGLDQYYPGVPRYQAFIREHITEHASISTLFGRTALLPDARAQKQGLRNRAWRQALNYPMQGSGQEILALALVDILKDPYLTRWGFHLSLVVHDEIVGFAPEDYATDCLKRVEYLMTSGVKLNCPLKVEGHFGNNWQECK